MVLTSLVDEGSWSGTKALAVCTRVCQSFHMPAKPPLFSRIVFGGKNEPWRGQENLSLTQAGHERAGVASYTRSTAFCTRFHG